MPELEAEGGRGVKSHAGCSGFPSPASETLLRWMEGMNDDDGEGEGGITIGVREGGSGGSGDPPVGLETSGSLEVS